MSVVLLITPLRSNLASTAKHHASAVDAMVRSCVSRARESLGALGRAERDNDSGQDEHLREFHLNLVPRPFANQKRLSSFFTGLARVLLREFSSSPRLTSRYKASRSLASCGPRASRVARARRASPVRAMLAARDRRSRGVAGFARSPPGLFGNFPVSKSPRGVLAGERVGGSAEVQKVGVAT